MSNMFLSKQESESYEDIIKSMPSQDKSSPEHFIRLVKKMNPKPSIKDIQDFRDYWMSKPFEIFKYPQFWEFKKWMLSSNRVPYTHCEYRVCDGTGYIEVYDIKKHDEEYEGGDVEFVRSCACVIGKDEHEKLMQEKRYSAFQEGIIMVNKDDRTRYKMFKS